LVIEKKNYANKLFQEPESVVNLFSSYMVVKCPFSLAGKQGKNVLLTSSAMREMAKARMSFLLTPRNSSLLNISFDSSSTCF